MDNDSIAAPKLELSGHQLWILVLQMTVWHLATFRDSWHKIWFSGAIHFGLPSLQNWA
jgi:hypothetical protein